MYRPLSLLLMVVLALAVMLSGCSKKGPVFVDDSAKYDAASVEKLLGVADISALSELPTTDATALRHSALSGLRKQGDSAAGVADLLTSTFEPDTRGVPVYVEKASFEGTSAVVVVEATGPKTGTFTMKRLWVLGSDGSVLLARSK